MNASFPAPPSQPGLLAVRPQRILALAFPFLPTDRIARKLWGPSWRSSGRPDHPPLVAAGRLRNSQRLVALEEQALQHGLKPDQGLAEARAICPALDVHPADPAADPRLLEALADWATRYTPLVSLSGEDGLFLDITGAAHLFGGEKGLIDDLLARLFHMGIDARVAIGATAGLSWALARFVPGTIAASTEAQAHLAPLPVAALRLPPETILLLVKAGLSRIGDLLHLPRAPLTRRFGPVLLRRLDQALGLEDEPLSPRLPVAALSVERRLAEPVAGEADVLLLAGQLAERLKGRLEEQGLGGRQFDLLLYRVDGAVFHLQAGTARPLRDPARIAALFAGRLEALRDDFVAGYGFETLRLTVAQSELFAERQHDLKEDDPQEAGLADFVEQAVARFGPGVLLSPVRRASHVPERASGFRPLLEALSEKPAAPSPPPFRGPRPLRLLARAEPVEAVAEVPEGPPVTFRWRRSFHRVIRAEGPERLAAEWWVDGEDAPTRDYYRIEDDGGRRYWLYREGLYEREPGPARWFMQGMFA